jgi:small GTP-binding protein
MKEENGENYNIEKEQNKNEFPQYKYEFLPENSNYDIIFKIMLIGDASVGKSSILYKMLNKEQKEKPTIGFDLLNLNIKVDEKICKIEIWDTCGQENYRSLMTKFYQNASLMILVYSINNRVSFEELNYWKDQITKFCKDDIKKILVGNKNDLENERVVQFSEGKEYCENNNFQYFVETSIQDLESIQKIFIKSAFLLYEEFSKANDDSIRLSLGRIDLEDKKDNVSENGIKSNDNNDGIKKKKSCC